MPEGAARPALALAAWQIAETPAGGLAPSVRALSAPQAQRRFDPADASGET